MKILVVSDEESKYGGAKGLMSWSRMRPLTELEMGTIFAMAASNAFSD